MFDKSSLHKWMPPYHYDTADFTELRKAYDAVGEDIDRINDALVSRKTPLTWDWDDCMSFLEAIGMGEEAELCLTIEELRSLVIEQFKTPKIMNEATFVGEIKKLWQIPYTKKLYTELELERTGVDVPPSAWTRSIEFGEDIHDNNLYAESCIAALPFAYIDGDKISIQGDFRAWGILGDTSIEFISDPIVYPNSGRRKLLHGEFSHHGDITDVQFQLPIRVALADLPAPRIRLIKKSSGSIPLRLPFKVDGTRLMLGSSGALSNVTHPHLKYSSYEPYTEIRRELPRIDINPVHNISVRVTVPMAYCETSWKPTELAYDRLVNRIYNKFPAGVRLQLDVVNTETEKFTVPVGIDCEIQVSTFIPISENIEYRGVDRTYEFDFAVTISPLMTQPNVYGKTVDLGFVKRVPADFSTNAHVYDISVGELVKAFDDLENQYVEFDGLVQTYDEFYHVEPTPPQTNGFIYDPSNDTLTPAHYDDDTETVTWEREQTEAWVLCYSNDMGAPATMAMGRCIVVKPEDADLIRSWGIEIEPVEGLGGAILWHPSWGEDYTEEDYAGGSFISKMYSDKEGTNVVIGWEETGTYPYQYGFSLGKIYTRLMISGGDWGEYPPVEYRSFLLYIKKPNV